MEKNIIKIIRREYSILGGWDETSWYATRSQALKLAANCQRGNANMAETPEEWAEEVINKGKNFNVYASTETIYSFRFLSDKEIEEVNKITSQIN